MHDVGPAVPLAELADLGPQGPCSDGVAPCISQRGQRDVDPGREQRCAELRVADAGAAEVILRAVELAGAEREQAECVLDRPEEREHARRDDAAIAIREQQLVERSRVGRLTDLVRDVGEQPHARQPDTVARNRCEPVGTESLERFSCFVEHPGLDSHPRRGRDEARLVRVLGGQRVEELDQPAEFASFPRDEQRLHRIGDPGGPGPDLLTPASRFLAAGRRGGEVAPHLRAHRAVHRGVPACARLRAHERTALQLRHRQVRFRHPTALEQVADAPHLRLHGERPAEGAELVVQFEPFIERFGTRQRGVTHCERHRDGTCVAGRPRQLQRFGTERLRGLDVTRVVARAGDPCGDERAQLPRLLGEPGTRTVEEPDDRRSVPVRLKPTDSSTPPMRPSAALANPTVSSTRSAISIAAA